MPQPDPGDSGRCAAPLPPVTATCAQREPDVWTRIKTEATPAARSRAARQSEPGELRGHRHGGSPAAAALPRPRPHACPRPATIAHHRRPPAHRSPPPARPVSAAIGACRRAPPRAPPPALRAPPAGLDLHPRRARPRRRHRPAAVTWRGSARPAPPASVMAAAELHLPACPAASRRSALPSAPRAEQ